jgi:hypothetical protein
MFTFAHSGRQLVWCFSISFSLPFWGNPLFWLWLVICYCCRTIWMLCMAINSKLGMLIMHGCVLTFWMCFVNLLRQVMLVLSDQFSSILLNTVQNCCFLGCSISMYFSYFIHDLWNYTLHVYLADQFYLSYCRLPTASSNTKCLLGFSPLYSKALLVVVWCFTFGIWTLILCCGDL